MRHLLILSLLLLLAPLSALAGQDWTRARREAEAQLRQQQAGQELIVRWETADPPSLPACSRLDYQWPDSLRGKVFVQVFCRSGQRWNARLPAWVSRVGLLAFAREALPREHAISEADIEWRRSELALFPEDALSDASQLHGRLVRQAVAAGQPVRLSQLRSAPVIMRQQQVRLRVRTASFSITSEGVAQNEAGVGERVRVRTPGGQIVEGVAREDGVVEVSP